MSPSGSGPPGTIFVIRHAEKPDTPGQSPFGVDVDGNQDDHSLLPRGWQRAGGITVLFAPADGHYRSGLQMPNTLRSPSYGHPTKTVGHRTYQTILPVSQRLDLSILSTFAEGDEAELVTTALADDAGVTLICWEHDHIPALASNIPTVAGTNVPSSWPGDRFDVVWCFDLESSAAAPSYTFRQVPQQLLSGDTDAVITP
jgi:hypothetical protein